MPMPEREWERAGQLYLMAVDAFGRGDAKLAEMFIARANHYANEAAAQSAQQQQPEPPKAERDAPSRADGSDRLALCPREPRPEGVRAGHSPKSAP
jgi:hypothetical protein